MAPRKGPSYSDSDDEYGDADWLHAQEQEQQKNKLKRKLRILGKNKRAHADEISKIVMNQEAQLGHLNKENDELTTAVDVVECYKNVMRDHDHTCTLQDLTDDIDDLDAMAGEEKQNIAKLEQELREIEDRLAIHRGLAVPSDMVLGKELARKTQTMENSHDHALVRFNTKLAANCQFREMIESVRKVKSKFDVLYRRLSDELKRTRKEMAASTEEASWRYHQRDEARMKIAALEERRDKDMTDFNHEMKEMERIVAYDNNLKEFMTAKGNDRQDYKEEEDAKKRRNLKPDRDEEAEKDEKELSGIISAMSPSDVTDILDSFAEEQEECFALFNYVNDLTDEVDRLQEVLIEMQTDVQHKEKEEVYQDSERILRQNHLKERYERARDGAKEAYKKNEHMGITLTEISNVVNKLFWDLECSRDDIDCMLACDSGVTERNILQYLGIIEQQTIELLHAKQYTQLKKLGPEEFDQGKDAKDRETAKKLSTHFAQRHLSTVIPPVISNLDTESFTRPLSVTELRAMVLKQRSGTPSRSTTPSSSSTLSPKSQRSSDPSNPSGSNSKSEKLSTDQDEVSHKSHKVQISPLKSKKGLPDHPSASHSTHSSAKTHNAKRSHKRSPSHSSSSAHSSAKSHKGHHSPKRSHHSPKRSLHSPNRSHHSRPTLSHSSTKAHKTKVSPTKLQQTLTDEAEVPNSSPPADESKPTPTKSPRVSIDESTSVPTKSPRASIDETTAAPVESQTVSIDETTAVPTNSPRGSIDESTAAPTQSLKVSVDEST